jgi:hypothetical protein
MVAGVFGAINLPSTSTWAVMGAKMRRYFTGCVALSDGRWTAGKIVSDDIEETAF